jgi:hypothetical protein
MSTVEDTASKLRGDAASQVIKSSLNQHKIDIAIAKLTKDLAANPPVHYESFVDNAMKVFAQTYQDTCDLLEEIKGDLQAVGAASAASQSPLGSLGHLTTVENLLKEIDTDIDDLKEKIDTLLSNQSKDTYMQQFAGEDGAQSAMQDIQSKIGTVLYELKAVVIPL